MGNDIQNREAGDGGFENAERLNLEIARSLARDFESIYYIDLESGSYITYETNGDFKSLNMQASGDDFFADAQRDVVVVHEDDRELMSKAMLRETIERETRDGRVFRFDYRLLFDGKPVYYNCKITRSVLDDRHVIIGVSNIHRQKEIEREYAASLEHALELAQRDELTGVRNRNAYIQTEGDMNLLISVGKLQEFALVLCDVNNLKDANDTCGHVAGDNLLRNACQIICSVFDHSAVFRIGGDEFLCVLRGRDYACREDLLTQVSEQSTCAAAENKAAGVVVDERRPVIACGMAVFDANVDSCVASVFERADASMYESKSALKASL